jgi:hypothetical protein
MQRMEPDDRSHQIKAGGARLIAERDGISLLADMFPGSMHPVAAGAWVTGETMEGCIFSMPRSAETGSVGHENRIPEGGNG